MGWIARICWWTEGRMGVIASGFLLWAIWEIHVPFCGGLKSVPSGARKELGKRDGWELEGAPGRIGSGKNWAEENERCWKSLWKGERKMKTAWLASPVHKLFIFGMSTALRKSGSLSLLFQFLSVLPQANHFNLSRRLCSSVRWERWAVVSLRSFLALKIL